jgi:hypothetical protein
MKKTLYLMRALLLCGLLSLCHTVQAHKASDAYLQLQSQGDSSTLRWDIALRDLDAMLDLDQNGDQKLSWGEVHVRLDDINAYALAHLQLQGGNCRLLAARAPMLESRVDGTYLSLAYQTSCALGDNLRVDYQLFREVDPTHRGLLRVDLGSGQAPLLKSLDPMAGPVSLPLMKPLLKPLLQPQSGAQSQSQALSEAGLCAASDAAGANGGFFNDGMHHILIGYDHILFLLCLLLPSVMQRRDGAWRPVGRWHDAVWPMLTTVTMFTLGHSITLALAGLQWVSLSPRIIEPAIALTIIAAAVNNLYPFLEKRRAVFTFFFGLIHGFGFAAVLSELDLPTCSFLMALLRFNLGVEWGQLLVVAAALTVLGLVRHWRRYPAVVLRVGSWFAVTVAATWFIERVFDLKWLPV